MREILYIIDTNAILDNLEYAIKNKKHVLISAHVIRELEKLKTRSDGVGQRARRASRYIDEHSNEFTFDLHDYHWDLNSEYDDNYVDNKLLKACIEKGYGLITNDTLLRIKARQYNVPILNIGDESSSVYTGFIRVDEDDERLANYFQKSVADNNPIGLLSNQYLIIEKTSGKNNIFRWDGKELNSIVLPSKDVVVPKNDLQSCALDLLWNKNIPIKFIAGTYGSGKTLLSVKVGIEYVYSREEFSSLTLVRNPIGAGEEIGFLKGTKEDKTDDFFKPIVQHIDGGEQTVFVMRNNGQLVKEIPYYMKGLSIENSFILVDEAEDLNKKLIKLLGTRVGKGSCIVFSGDFEQAEDKFAYNNGLYTAIESLKGDKLVGVVVLEDDVRSNASKVFTKL